MDSYAAIKHTQHEPEAQHDHAHVHHGHHPHGRPKNDEVLDDMHDAIKFYLGGALSLARLEESSPRSILEMGSGTGAWAIQAAEQFPEAEVLAIDLTPPPSRFMPSNLRFQIVDMTKPFPFQPQTFDIVHSRFVFHHLSNFDEALNRTMQLVKPGGWLILEEIVFREDGKNVFWKQFQRYMMGHHSTPLAGVALQGNIESSELFSDVNVKKIVLPLSKCDDPQVDVAVRRITMGFKSMLNQVLQAMKAKPIKELEANNLTLESVEGAQREINDPNYNAEVDVYMTWSRRSDL